MQGCGRQLSRGLRHPPAPTLPALPSRYQLVYAWGASEDLPSQQIRTLAVQAVLRQLSQHAPRRGNGIGATLALDRVSVAAWPADKPGAFRGPRLLPGEALHAALPELRRQLAEAVLRDPPYAMQWLQGHPHHVSRGLGAAGR